VTRRDGDGQTLVLFALVLVVLVGISALVVDVGLKYSTERRYQAVADAAALAGAQELKPTSRSTPVSPGMQLEAREAALAAIMDELLPAAGPTTCASWSSCELPGGQYRIAIVTPSPVCVDCEPDRAILVTITEPRHPNTFAGVFGQSTWALSRTSVAGLSFGAQYAIVTLRPPEPLGHSSGFDVRDFRIEGGTTVSVVNGDVGTNANMEYGGTNSLLVLDDGYGVDYFDPYNPPQWSTPPDPAARHIGALIADPGYVIPSSAGGPAGMQDAAETAGSTCATAAASLYADAGYGPYVPATGTTPDMDRIECWTSGVYGSTLSVSNGHLAILEPGLYWLSAGMDVQGSVIGGYLPADEGVALVFRQDATNAQSFNVHTNGAGIHALALNAGTRFGDRSGGDEAGPALDYAGHPIVTNTDPALKLTLMVTRDTACPVADPYPGSCNDTQNDTIAIQGNSDLYLAGVQFMPSDNTSINSSAAMGYVGQIWAWTIKYSGGVTLTQEGLAADGPGQVRIDTACSPGAACD
jgi:hypothetical protein